MANSLVPYAIHREVQDYIVALLYQDYYCSIASYSKMTKVVDPQSSVHCKIDRSSISHEGAFRFFPFFDVSALAFPLLEPFGCFRLGLASASSGSVQLRPCGSIISSIRLRISR